MDIDIGTSVFTHPILTSPKYGPDTPDVFFSNY